ncbi:MAG: AtpZ/AtpI family protein [Vicinamibacteria bacterium]
MGTSPWLTLLGFAVGLAAGVLNVVRIMSGIRRMEEARAATKAAETPPPDGETGW